MRGRARGEWMEAAVASMLRSNAAAARVARAHGATACTDVSGFGLAGHLGEMLRASKCAAVLDLAALPLLPGAGALLARGDRSTFHPENAKARRALVMDAERAGASGAGYPLRPADLGRPALRGAGRARGGGADRAARSR